MSKIRYRAEIVEDVPSRLLTLQLPPGISLDKWVKMETARLRHAYPEPKELATELDPELAEMLITSKAQLKRWTKSYQLTKLEIRGELGFHQVGTVRGVPFAERRMYPVKGYTVHPYDLDAIFPL